MSIKENVDYVKNELSSEEKFLENFVKGERFFKKYRTLIFTFIAIAILVTIGMLVKQKIEESNKLEANIAFNKFLENADEKELFIIKDKNEKLKFRYRIPRQRTERFVDIDKNQIKKSSE